MTTDPPRSDTLVMFGASGDLAKKKLFPAIYRLSRRGLLDIPVIGVALDDWSADDLREHARSSVADNPDEDFDQKAFDKLASQLHYVKGNYEDPTLFPALARTIDGAKHPIFHLAIPPSLFATVADGLAGAGLNQGSRLIIEKPFGRDLTSAIQLNDDLRSHFAEDQVFRIDHFLGKEVLRGLMVARFANTVLEPVWNRNYVASVKITMAEEFGVADRGHFYDSVGALKDVVQNHLLQMTALIGMDQPVDEQADSQRDEKRRILKAVQPLTPDRVVRGQYRGYLDVDGVADGSDTETFVAVQLDIDSPRWAGVPFLIRAGKSLARTVTEWTVEFRSPPRPLFVQDVKHPPPHNTVRFQVKPAGPPVITLLHKVPGEGMKVAPSEMCQEFTGPAGIDTEPYELLIEEAMAGDPTLFARIDSVIESWRIVDPILDDHRPVIPYDVGSWGPAEATALAAPAGGWPGEPVVPT